MTLSIKPQNNNLNFRSSLIREEQQPGVAIFSSTEHDREMFLSICSWCKRIQLSDDTWAEVEIAIRNLNLFQSDLLPGLTHGICPDCKSNHLSTLK